MNISRLAVITMVAVGSLVASTGCHHVHRDLHRWERGDRYDRHRRYGDDGRWDRQRDRHHQRDGRHRGWWSAS